MGNEDLTVRGGVCIWSEYTPDACLKREEV